MLNESCKDLASLLSGQKTDAITTMTQTTMSLRNEPKVQCKFRLDSLVVWGPQLLC